MNSDKRSLAVRPQARLDLVELATYISRDSADAAWRLLDAAEETFEFLAMNSQAGAIYSTKNAQLVGLRVFQIRDFPNHLSFYLERELSIEIVRVLHGARNVDAVLNLE